MKYLFMNTLVFALMAVNFIACSQTNNKLPVTTSSPTEINTSPDADSMWTEKIVKTDEEWKKILTKEQYHITREQGTERPFSSPLYEVHDEGKFVCVCCDNPLFSSKTKFDSGTGWPSFFSPYSSKSVSVSTDNSVGMSRDEISCQRCGAHLGHVFNDGPAPTGLRYCMDGVALKFNAKATKESGAVATFAGGCFWCEEYVFESIKGVQEVVSGYSGGKEKSPNYEDVGDGKTGHAESFEVYYNPAQISYADLIRVYFASIDPTQVNGQGPDNGKQYRSIIFYRNEAEKKTADDFMAMLATKLNKSIAVEVKPYDFFVKAEEYHQNYVRQHPENPYVQHESIPRRNRALDQVKDLVKK